MDKDTLELTELPFPLTASHPGIWRADPESGVVSAEAPAHTDLYMNPGGDDADDAESLFNAAFLAGPPPSGDFQFSARITVDFRSTYDAGVLFLLIDERHWAKFCFEFSPAGDPMVVSVVTQDVSDDANAFTVADRSAWFRISRLGVVYAFHASTDGVAWQLIRVFSLGADLPGHQLGFEVQSPTGDGCAVTFADIHFSSTRLADLRDGS